MITKSVIINYTSWAYDVTNRYMAALRGHKYHILPTSSSPLTISFALLFFFLTLVFNFHGARVNFTGFDSFVGFLLESGHKKFFGKIVEELYFIWNIKINASIIENFNVYSHIHIFWIAPLFLSLGIFFLWSSNAIFEGATSKISLFSFKKGEFLYAGKVIVEPLFHTNLVRKGFKIGFILFIISEIMFFFGFFWGFFHSSISPTIQIGAVWPPVDVEFITVKGFAVANTVILLTSGATLTVAHYAFELIPQKRNKLFKQNVPFTESEESFETRLSDEYNGLNKKFFNSAKPEIYWIPLVRFFTKLDGITTDRASYRFVLPFNVLFNPFKKYFEWNYGLQDTETLVKIYINLMLDATLLLAILFMVFQGTEYFISPVNINTGIYGSTFYMITGLHGAHVFIGSCFLLYCRTAVGPLRNIWAFYLFLYRLLSIFVKNVYLAKFLKIEENTEKNVFSSNENVNAVDHYGRFGIESFESAAWYWHFVDVVWIFVFGFVYVWSHLTVLEQQ